MPKRFLPSPAALNSSYDVVIIGGGVQGLSLAYHLAVGGQRNVAVFERSYLAGGASGRNLSVIRSNYSSDEWTRLYWESRKIWETISVELDFNVMFTQRGYVMCTESPAMAETARSVVARQNALGVPTRYLAPADLKGLVPAIDTDALVGAQYDPTAGVSRHDALVWGYAAAAARLGVHVHVGVEVQDILVRGDRAEAVVTDRGTVHAGAIVNCAGSQSARVGRMADAEVPTQMLPLEMFVTDAYEPFIDPVVALLEAQCYMHQTSRGEFVCGAEVTGAHGDQLHTTHDWLRHAARQYVKFFPDLANVHAVRCWAGLLDMSPDGSGLAGEVAGRPGFYVLCGWGGYGYMVAPATGRFMAEYLVRGVMPEPLAPFDLKRLAEGRTINESFLAVDYVGETREE